MRIEVADKIQEMRKIRTILMYSKHQIQNHNTQYTNEKKTMNKVGCKIST